MIRAFLIALCAIAAACSRPADPTPAAKPPVAGLDPAAFDKNVRPQDDLFLHVNGAWLANTEIPGDTRDRWSASKPDGRLAQSSSDEELKRMTSFENQSETSP